MWMIEGGILLGGVWGGGESGGNKTEGIWFVFRFGFWCDCGCFSFSSVSVWYLARKQQTHSAFIVIWNCDWYLWEEAEGGKWGTATPAYGL